MTSTATPEEQKRTLPTSETDVPSLKQPHKEGKRHRQRPGLTLLEEKLFDLSYFGHSVAVLFANHRDSSGVSQRPMHHGPEQPDVPAFNDSLSHELGND